MKPEKARELESAVVTTALNFASELDNPVPDLVLRAIYRKAFIEACQALRFCRAITPQKQEDKSSG